MKTTIEESPRVYCGTYHKYNSGSLAGEWIDLDQFDSLKDLYAYFRELHKDEADPEYMLLDREYVPEGMIGESWIDEHIYEYINLSDEDKTKFDVINDAHGSHYYDSVAELIEKLEDVQMVETGEAAQDYIAECYPELDTVSNKFHFVRLDWSQIEESFFMDWAQGSDSEGNSYHILMD